MQKYLDQVDKYLNAQQAQKTFLAKNQTDLFFLKAENESIYLYHLNLAAESARADLQQAKKVVANDLSKCNFDFLYYDVENKILYFKLDEKNNEFANIFRLQLSLQQPSFEQLTEVKHATSPCWSQDHQTLYFINRFPMDGGLFKNEFYRLDLKNKKQTFLFDDQDWVYKVGWGGFLLSTCETFLIICVDKDNKRELTNLVKYDLHQPTQKERPRLLPASFEDGLNVLVKSVSPAGFYFQSDSSKFINLYYFDFKTQVCEAITDKKWANITVGIFKFNQHETYLVAEPIKAQDQTQLTLIDLSTRQSIQKKLDGNYVVLNGQGVLIKNAIDQPPTYSTYNEKLEIGVSFSKYSGKDLVHCTFESMTYKSFDGLDIQAYFIKPKTPIRAVAVIAFYGGENYYHFHEQLFLENGIALFSPAVRGSWGWGRDWEDHLKGDLGGKEILDVIWAAKAIAKKLDLPENKVGLHGASHGGYALLRALTLPKDFGGVDSGFDFGFGVCECGFADLEDFFHTSRIADWLVDLLGSYPEHKKLYQERSPTHFFKNLKTPLFIRHGTTDTRVPLSTMQSFIDQLGKSDIQHEVMIQENQGHHTNDPTKLKIERARILSFIERVLN